MINFPTFNKDFNGKRREKSDVLNCLQYDAFL